MSFKGKPVIIGEKANNNQNDEYVVVQNDEFGPAVVGYDLDELVEPEEEEEPVMINDQNELVMKV